MKDSLNIMTRIEHPMVKTAVVAILQDEFGYPVHHNTRKLIDDKEYPYLAIHNGNIKNCGTGSTVYIRCEAYNLNQFLRLAKEHQSKIYIGDDIVEFFNDCIIVGDYRFSHETVKEVYKIITDDSPPKDVCVHIPNDNLKLAIVEKLIKDFPSSQTIRDHVENVLLLDRDYIALYKGKVQAGMKDSLVEMNCQPISTIEEFMETVYEQGKRKRIFHDIEFYFDKNYIRVGCGVKVTHKTIIAIYDKIMHLSFR